MDDSLEPIVKNGLQCIDEDLIFSLHEDDKEPVWKIVFLVFICIKHLIRMIGILHQRKLLKSDIEDRYNALDGRIKEILPLEQLKESC